MNINAGFYERLSRLADEINDYLERRYRAGKNVLDDFLRPDMSPRARVGKWLQVRVENVIHLGEELCSGTLYGYTLFMPVNKYDGELGFAARYFSKWVDWPYRFHRTITWSRVKPYEMYGMPGLAMEIYVFKQQVVVEDHSNNATDPENFMTLLGWDRQGLTDILPADLDVETIKPAMHCSRVERRTFMLPFEGHETPESLWAFIFAMKALYHTDKYDGLQIANVRFETRYNPALRWSCTYFVFDGFYHS